MKNLIAASLFLVGVSFVLAHTPSVRITAVGGQDATSGSVTLNVSTLPTAVNIDGSVTHDDPGNVDGVKLTLSDNGVIFYGPTNYFAGLGNVGTANFSLPWTINGDGNHQIVATASHGNSDGTDTVDVTVLLNIVVNQCPAAPSVAAHYLQGLGVKPGSATFKNVISLVAHHMGPQTDFDGVHACDAGYATAVKVFVNSHMSVPK